MAFDAGPAPVALAQGPKESNNYVTLILVRRHWTSLYAFMRRTLASMCAKVNIYREVGNGADCDPLSDRPEI